MKNIRYMNMNNMKHLQQIQDHLGCVFWGVGNFNVTNVKQDRWEWTKPGKYGVD